MARKIYVASSWRNVYQPFVVAELRKASHEVYDFRNPGPGNKGFHWSEIDENWQQWTAPVYRHELWTHPLCDTGFNCDMVGLEWCNTCVLLLPCGRSAHLEAGWAIGSRKYTIIQLSPEDDIEPELMYKMANYISLSLDETIEQLGMIVELKRRIR